jgi:hypothetical protein
MPVELPLFLVPAFSGAPVAKLPEWYANKRAMQRVDKFFALCDTITQRPEQLAEYDVASEVLADANRTIRAINHALKKFAKYQAIRPHDEEAKKLEECLSIVEDRKQVIIDIQS